MPECMVIRMSSSDFSTEISEIRELFKDETKIGIVIILDFYYSMNLTQLSDFFDKSGPNLLYHVKSLLEDGLIEVDNSLEYSKKRGKYYRLTSKGKNLMRIMHESGNTVIPTEVEDEQNLITATDMLSAFTSLVSQFQRYATLFLRRNYNTKTKKLQSENLTDEKREFLDDSGIGNLSLSNEWVSITSIDQGKRLREGMDNLLSIINEINKENLDSKDTIKLFFYQFMAPLSEMHPKNLKSEVNE
ncbi:MAG: winged helix-turn-helix transcriptional regulator [Candidatus Heimdallarchaeota archaeon]|nr:winged helix-turn-helix transcriptional regulator [Candidatus Heimdallarchaeota archaeon]